MRLSGWRLLTFEAQPGEIQLLQRPNVKPAGRKLCLLTMKTRPPPLLRPRKRTSRVLVRCKHAWLPLPRLLQLLSGMMNS